MDAVRKVGSMNSTARAVEAIAQLNRNESTRLSGHDAGRDGRRREKHKRGSDQEAQESEPDLTDGCAACKTLASHGTSPGCGLRYNKYPAFPARKPSAG